MTLTVPMRDAAGRLLNLAKLTPADIDFPAIAAALARQNRYAGNTSVPVNVAQHSLIAAACAEARGNAWTVPYVLLHDAHEAFIGDITTPAANFIALYSMNSEVAHAIELAKHHLDKLIYRAAGLYPKAVLLPGSNLTTAIEIESAIKQADRDAYLIELRDFHRCVQPGDPDFQAMTEIGAIMPRRQKPMSIADSEMALMQAFNRHLPCFGAAAPQIKGAA